MVTEYYDEVIHRLKSSLQAPEKFRRGSVERAVAEALGLTRLHRYDDVLTVGIIWLMNPEACKPPRLVKDVGLHPATLL